jgi:APA family basic amino acid/polyamine antiporter
MARDGLIPDVFMRVHPVWRTPWVAQLIFGTLIAVAGALFPIGILGSLTNMATLVAFCLVSLAVPLLRRRHPELAGKFQVPFGPLAIPALSIVSSLSFIYYLKIGNPLVWGFFPLVWLSFLIWLALGLIVYFAYGRRNSRIALEELGKS